VSKPTLKEIILVFAKLGTIAFGGPAAHIAMMEDEVVRRRRWLSREEFLDLLGATNLVPGPNSTELAIHIGYKVGGWLGLFAAGIAFIGPAFLIVWALAWFYVKFGALPAFQSIFVGVKPVILAVISQAIWNLSLVAIKDRLLAFLAALALGFYLIWGQEILVLALVALFNLLIRKNFRPPTKGHLLLALLSSLFLHPLIKAWAQVSEELKIPTESLFGYFAKVGSVLFGSGYVLIAFLQSDLVEKYHWLTQQQLVDAIAVGQFTPGPVFTTATFIGYLISGNTGAVVATLGIFAPAFLFVALSSPFIPTLRRSPWTAPLLDGLNVASLSLMAGASLILAKGAVTSIYGSLVFCASLGLLIKHKINSTWLILGAGLLGYFGLTN